MKIGIMQPYFFPYPGYFSLIAQCDTWVVFDVPQYIRHGWVNRNRILHPKEGWQYIVVPLEKHSRNTAIRDIRISRTVNWPEKILRQIEHYKKRAPFYEGTAAFLEDCLKSEADSLVALNIELLHITCTRIGIDFAPQVASQLPIDTSLIKGPGDWALVISELLGASEYINPPGGAHLFNADAFEKAGIKLTIQDYESMHYSCPGYENVPDLSIVDALMWNPADTIRKHLLKFT